MTVSKFSWLPDVLEDVLRFAEQNNLPRIAEELKCALVVASYEIAEVENPLPKAPPNVVSLSAHS